MIKVTPRSQRHADRSGDPLDGLVNLFDLGIVLAVGFLLAALQSADLTSLLTSRDITVIRKTPNGQTIVIKKGDRLKTLKLSQRQAAGTGTKVGTVYRLSDGRLVYATGK